MILRLELFVEDIERSRDFYAGIIGFRIDSAEPGGYTRLSSGGASIALNPIARIPKSHPSRQPPGERVGLGHEIDLVVEDIEGFYENVQAAGGQIAEPLKVRPWGAKDFCLQDPDGNYIRITTS
jgi:catechol 2,3-dioxygenase-like lactoylglutathione lyase family enzyme